ncbi:MAG: aldo/keto reductase, partial [Candidatus Cryptobacteroides sp.]
MKPMNRREFLKSAGCGTAAVAIASVTGCSISPGAGKETGEEGMTYRTNPANSDKVSILGYGCMRWPMEKDDDKDVIDQDEVDNLVDYAISHGINYFDTAPVYLQGMSESCTAEALSRYPRESYFLATKLSNFSDSSREASMAMYNASFENLRTDYIDYYLLHSIGGGGMENFRKRYVDNGMLEFLMEEREKGKIRNLGFSFHGDKECFDSLMQLHESIRWDFVQIQLNYLDWRHAGKRNTNAEYLYGELEKRGIPAIVMEPLLGGRLAKLPDHIYNRLVSRNPSQSAASWAFRFAGTHPGVLCVLSGMTYMEHLKDNLKTYSPLVPLTEGEMAFLEETAVIMQDYPQIPCNNCQDCMPCPYGIDIPSILLHY